MISSTNKFASRTLVLGLGNPLMGDDGLGVAVLHQLRQDWAIPAGVELVDGGTWGMNLLPLVESARHLILIDAIRSGAAPGTLVVLEPAELPRYFSLKISPHQIDLREVLALAELRGLLPDDLVAIGLEPERVDLELGLSPRVAARLDLVVNLVLERLEWAGHRCGRRMAISA
ncbi:MAG TPA: HyaD/HybD family hydrogenase maturation endopeptidase [Gemmatimonadales bacterium]|nr:HyaD/HybD family hydrogenase maturation endopeptidase [Gemmatimonadales bacterium]